jgi:hypothetical protein
VHLEVFQNSAKFHQIFERCGASALTPAELRAKCWMVQWQPVSRFGTEPAFPSLNQFFATFQPGESDGKDRRRRHEDGEGKRSQVC